MIEYRDRDRIYGIKQFKFLTGASHHFWVALYRTPQIYDLLPLSLFLSLSSIFSDELPILILFYFSPLHSLDYCVLNP